MSLIERDFPRIFARNTLVFDAERFRGPRAVERPVPFYSWNERMEPDEVRRQVRLIAEGGWGGIFVHSRIGLTTPYLGEEWFAAVDAAIEECAALGLKVWLYDEDKWPSGFSGGTVPLANKAYRQQALVARPADLPPPPDCEPLGKSRDGLQIYIWTAPLGHDWFNGTCYAGLMHREAMRKFLDDAYETYFKRYGRHYGELIVGEFTDEPCSIFRLRLPQGSVPFTPQLIERFREMHGYDPVAKLHLLYAAGRAAERFRLHYFRTVNDLFENNFSRQLGEWCSEHGIALTGHYMCEDGLYLQQVWGVKIMPNYRHETIPGIDHLGRHVGNAITAKQCQSVANQYGKPRMLSELYGVAGGSLSFEDRAWIAAQQMCLGVNVLNPHLSLYTMSGCRKRDYPQNIFYQQPFWPVNQVVDDRLSRVCAALSQGRYVAEALVIHPGESSFVHWQTQLEPEKFDRLIGWDWDPVSKEARARIEKMDCEFKAVLDALLGAQRTFDLGDETILGEIGEVDLSASRPLLRVGEMAYPAVILPSMTTIASTTVALIENFMAAGGTVLRCGEAPRLMEGAPEKLLRDFLGRIPKVGLRKLADQLAEAALPMVDASALKPKDRAKLWVHVRDFDSGERLVYLVNLNRKREFSGEIGFGGSYAGAWLLDTETGEQKPIAATGAGGVLKIQFAFAPAQTYLLRLSRSVEDAAADGISLVKPSVKSRQTVAPAKLSVRRLDDNALTLDYAYWRRDSGDWSQRAAPVLGLQEYLNSAKYDGPLTLQYPVTMRGLAPERKVHLVVEYPERYTVRVNGREVAYSGLPAWRDFRWMPIDITGLLSEGENRIELDCANFQHGDLTSIEDAFARYGTEIESIYLVGDFAVQGQPLTEKPFAKNWEIFDLPHIGLQCFAHEKFVLTDPRELGPGDATLQSLPFYAGRLELSARLPKLDADSRWFLALERLDCAVAEVKIDGTTAGYFLDHPLELEITDAVRAGGRRMAITLYGTLRNLLGPHHNPEGELAAVGPPDFSAEPVLDEQEQNVWVLRWVEGQELKGWTDRYCMVSFGDVGRIRLLKR